MRVVADTNIVISGFLWHGNPHRILDAARDGIIELFTSPLLLEELTGVLSRDRFLPRLKAVNTTIEMLVEDYGILATVIDAPVVERIVIRDSDDDIVIACAVAGDCDAIVTGNDDLLSLEQHRTIKILTATELLAELYL